MRQASFSRLEVQGHKRVTRKAAFLKRMETLVPWSDLEAVIEPHYPKGKRGRPPIGLARMLRLHFLQRWFSLSDEAVEDTLYDMPAFREFVGVDLWNEAAPDAPTLLKYRRRLERHELTRQLFESVNEQLSREGLQMREGTLIYAPPSTKNADRARDPQMHQTRKGNEWYFGMKAHIGADEDSGLVHTLHATAANKADVSQTEHLLHGDERRVWADAGYIGADKREALSDRPIQWQIARRRSTIKALPEGHALRELLKQVDTLKARVRARVEHPFQILKNLFGHRKTRYKGLAKNTAQLYSLFALVNLVKAARLRAFCA